MQRLRLVLPALATAGALGLGGCAAFSDDAETVADSRTVAVGLYPLQYVAARVAGDAFEVENLTTPGGEPHDLTLGLQETATVAEAALVVHVDSLQPGVDEAAEEVARGEVLDAADVVDLLPFAEAEHHDHEGHEDGDEASGHEEGHDHEEEGHDHDHGDLDPHFWQDPLRMATLGDAIAERLGEIDPEGRADFAANAAALRADLEELDQAYAEGLAGCAVTTLVTTHDAFGYLGKYGLRLESITGITPDAEPTPAALADLQDLIASDGVTTVFSESLVSAKAAATLAADAGVRTEVLDTLEGLSDATADEDYLSLMRQNLTKIEEANRC